MQVILADIGNSSIKLTGFRSGETPDPEQEPAITRIRLTGTELSVPQDLTSDAIQPLQCMFSSVNDPAWELFQSAFLEIYPQTEFVRVTGQDVPLKSNVVSRSKLGVDRLLAAWAARQFTSTTGPLIVIDAGTTVTIDLVDRESVFQGGVIFPGSRIGFDSLGSGTAALPVAAYQRGDQQISLEAPIGKSTDEAIVRGVIQAQAFGMRGIVDRIAATQDEPCTVCTSGGELPLVADFLPDDWVHVDELVIRGLLLLVSHRAAARDGS